MTTDDKIRDEKLQYDIIREAAKILALLSGKLDKYEYLTGEEILPSNQRQIIEQAKFTYSLLGKAFEKQTKTIKEQGRKQIDAITDQNERLVASANKDDHNDDHKDIYKEIFDKLAQEKFDEIKELTYEIDYDDLTYYFTGNKARKTFDDFNNEKELFRKIQSGEIKLEESKKLQHIFKSNLNKILRGRFKSNEQKSASKNTKSRYELREAVIKLFNNHSSVVSEAKYKAKHGKALNILTPKQMFQRLPTALTQVKAINTSETY